MNTTFKQYWAFAIAALTVLATACGGAKKFDLLCEPGETGQPVTCADKTQGFLKCNKEGSAFTETTCVTGQLPQTGCGAADAKCCLGQTISCGCTDGRTGSQMCKSDCSGFDTCLCTGSVPGAGGNVGTGGTTGVGGSNVGGSSTGGSSGVGGSMAGGSAGSSTGGSAGTGGTSGTGGTGGSSTGCSNPNKACNFGEVFACHCVQDGQVLNGSQGCEPDCSARTECVCQASDAGTGGTGGTGGAGGSSGQGGTSGTGGTGGSANVCSDASKRLCVSGQDNLCHCLVNGQVVNGLQLCNANCDGWTTCSCGTGGQGGSSGQGGSGGTGGTGGTGGATAVQADVVCVIKHVDNTQFKFDLSTLQFSHEMHNYRVFVSDLGVDGQGIYAGEHVQWGQDSKLHVQQFGDHVTITFLSTVGSLLDANATRDPVGTDETSANYWREPASDRNPLAPRMLWECTMTANGVTSHMQWPTAIDTGTGTNLRLIVRPITPNSNDEDGDGVAKNQDCNDSPEAGGFYKRGDPLADKNLWLPEVEQDGIDNDCVHGDLKYRRAVMNASSSGLGTPMVFWDSWKYGVSMAFSSSLWASTYVPSNLMPKDKMAGQTMFQPAGLVRFFGSGTGCYNGECWNMYKTNNGTCVDVYPVYLETPDHLQLPSTSALNADGQCRVFFAAAQ